MDTTIGNMVEAYLLDIKYKNFNKTAVKNLFFGSKKVLKEERDFIFFNQDQMSTEKKIADQDTAVCIIEAVKSSLKLYPKNKKTVIDIYKDFLDFIDKNYHLKITMAFPEWLPTNSLERQLHIGALIGRPDYIELGLFNAKKFEA